MLHSDRVCRAVFWPKSPASGPRRPDGNQMFPDTETSPHGLRRNGATLCPACKISPTQSSFVGLSVKSGHFVCSGHLSDLRASATEEALAQRRKLDQERGLTLLVLFLGMQASPVSRRELANSGLCQPRTATR